MRKWRIKKKIITSCIIACMFLFIMVVSINSKSIFTNSLSSDKKLDANTDTNAYKARQNRVYGDGFQISYFSGFSASQMTDARAQAIAENGFTNGMMYSYHDQWPTADEETPLFKSALSKLNDNYLNAYIRPTVPAISLSIQKKDYDHIFNLLNENHNVDGIFFRDEPNLTDYDKIKAVFEKYSKQEAYRPIFMNLLPNYVVKSSLGLSEDQDFATNYTNKYFSIPNMRFLSVDHYPQYLLWDSPDWHDKYMDELKVIAENYHTKKIRGEATIPQNIILVSESAGYDNITETDIYYQINTALAFGSKNIMYFAYCVKSCDPGYYEGHHLGLVDPGNEHLDEVKNINNRWLYNLGTELYYKDVYSTYKLEGTDVESYLQLNQADQSSLVYSLRDKYKNISSSNKAIVTLFNDKNLMIVNDSTTESTTVTFNTPLTNLQYFNPIDNTWHDYVTGANITFGSNKVVSISPYTSREYTEITISPACAILLRTKSDGTISSKKYIVNNAEKYITVFADNCLEIHEGSDLSISCDNISKDTKAYDSVNKKYYSLKGITESVGHNVEIEPSYIYAELFSVLEKDMITTLNSTTVKYFTKGKDLPVLMTVFDGRSIKRLPIITFIPGNTGYEIKKNSQYTQYYINVPDDEFDPTAIEFTNAYLVKVDETTYNLYLNSSDVLITTFTIRNNQSGSASILKSLTTSVGDVNETVLANRSYYTLPDVENSTSSITIDAEAFNDASTITIESNGARSSWSSDTCELTKTGNEINECKIMIQYKTGNTYLSHYYIIRVRRKDASEPIDDAYLTSLSVSCEDINFNKDINLESNTFDYSLNMPDTAFNKTIKIKYKKQYENSFVEDEYTLSNSTSNSYSIVVPLSNGQTGNTYNITIDLKSTDNNLKSLKVGNKTITLSTATSYTVSVPSSTETVDVIATKAAKATFEGDISNDGTATWDMTDVESIEKTITVISEYGTIKDYTITVNKSKPHNADISSLKISVGALLSPSFKSDVTEYNIKTEKRTVKVEYVSASGGESKSTVFILPDDVTSKTFELYNTALDGTTSKKYTFNVELVDKVEFDEVGALTINAKMNSTLFNDVFNGKADNLVLSNFEVEDTNILEIKNNSLIPKQAGTTRLIYDKYSIEITVPEINADGEVGYKITDSLSLRELFSIAKNNSSKVGLSNNRLIKSPMLIDYMSNNTVDNLNVIIEDDSIAAINGDNLVILRNGNTTIVIGENGHYYSMNIEGEKTVSDTPTDVIDSTPDEAINTNQSLLNPKTGDNYIKLIMLLIISISVLIIYNYVLKKKEEIINK